MFKNLQIFLILCLAGYAFGQTTLGGQIGGMTLDSLGSPYLVTENLLVPANKSLTIKAGCVFLFKAFTGINVEGSIEAIGTKEHPIVFTTVNDIKYSSVNTEAPANAFDWNGIHVTDKATEAYFANTLISYSVFGLKSQLETVGIESCVFYDNGQFHATIDDKILQVRDGFPFSLNSREGEKNLKPKSPLIMKKAVPAIIGGAGLVSGIIAGVSGKNFSDKKSEYDSETDFTKQDNLDQQAQTEITKAAVFGGVSIIAISTAIILYLRNNKQPEKIENLSVSPFLQRDNAGVLLTFRF